MQLHNKFHLPPTHMLVISIITEANESYITAENLLFKFYTNTALTKFAYFHQIHRSE